MKHAKLSAEEAKDMNGMALKIVEEYSDIIKKFISKKGLSYKDYIDNDNKHSMELIIYIEKAIKEMIAKNYRLLTLRSILCQEIDYRRDNNLEMDNSIYIIINRINAFRKDNIKKEIGVLLGIRNKLKEENVKPGSRVSKAIKWNTKKMVERYTGKNNPIELYINDIILYTAYSSANPLLRKSGKTIWQDANERVTYPLFSDDVTIELENIVKASEEDIISSNQKIYEIIAWCYENNRLNFVDRRQEIIAGWEEVVERKKEEKKIASSIKKNDIINRRMQKFINQHNRWYILHSTSYKPSGFEDFLDRSYGKDISYVYIGMSKINKKVGYVTMDYGIDTRMRNCLICNSSKEAIEAEKIMKNKLLAFTRIKMHTKKISETMEVYGPGGEEDIEPKRKISVVDQIINEHGDKIVKMLESGLSHYDISKQLNVSLYDAGKVIEKIKKVRKVRKQYDAIYEDFKDEIIHHIESDNWLAEELVQHYKIGPIAAEKIIERAINEYGYTLNDPIREVYCMAKDGATRSHMRSFIRNAYGKTDSSLKVADYIYYANYSK